ncbi:hypothetical protein [Croceicoccus gelatinilyticus]|uniref:hypothetical protein n=1 Tax=Croceicoccus gelatinilyticus TaxID=2835536 RepID=UPI001BCB35AE|nr:hypothetical protein [Croceicoccus gelatinilyticus]MBS7670703.1 hypothetical protein [Croceicoccus gelatinilyticus]
MSEATAVGAAKSTGETVAEIAKSETARAARPAVTFEEICEKFIILIPLVWLLKRRRAVHARYIAATVPVLKMYKNHTFNRIAENERLFTKPRIGKFHQCLVSLFPAFPASGPTLSA